MNGADRNPDFDIDMEFSVVGGSTFTAPAQVFLPVHAYDRPIIRFKSQDITHNSLLGHKILAHGTLGGFGGRDECQIVAKDLYVKESTLRFRSSPAEPIVDIEAEPDVLITNRFALPASPGETDKAQVEFTLTRNGHLGEPRIKTFYPDGKTEFGPGVFPSIPVPPVGRLSLEPRYYKEDNQDGSYTVHRKNSAIIVTDVPEDRVDWVLDSIKPNLDLALTMLSLAARERTIATACSITDLNGGCITDLYFGNLELPENTPRRSSMNLLIDSRDLKKFLDATCTKLFSLGSAQQQHIELGVMRILPRPHMTMESRYLSVFSALESILLLFRRTYDYEFSVSGRPWKKIIRDLRKTLESHAKAFAREGDLERAIDALPGINRIPMRHAFDAFCQQYKVDLESLWPLYSKKDEVSLYRIRNKIVHGEYFPEWQHGALWRALLNLVVVLERCILGVLTWPIEKTHVSGSALSTYNWVGNQNLEMYMGILSKKEGQLEDEPT